MRRGVDSLAQWLEHWIFILEDRVRFPGEAEFFFQLCFIPLLRLSCRKRVKRTREIYTSPYKFSPVPTGEEIVLFF